MPIQPDILASYFFSNAWLQLEKEFGLDECMLEYSKSCYDHGRENVFELITKQLKRNVYAFTIREILEVKI